MQRVCQNQNLIQLTVLKKLQKEIKGHLLVYILLAVALIGGLFLRVYRVDKILGFYFDQGRDALVIWDFLYNHKFFLIGPTTGLAGIFRGPYYYYLIAPFYFLGRGDPVWPSVFLALTTIMAGFLGYILGKKILNREAGVIFAILSSFSFNIIFASRWLSNPTPMLLLSMVLVWAMIKATEGKKWAWPVIALTSGLSLFNFGSSGELFYFPALFIFLIWQWKNRPDFKNLVISVILFTLTFAPLVLFDLKHEGILRNNIINTFGGQKSFVIPSFSFVSDRTKLYYDIFTNKIFQDRKNLQAVALGVVGLSFLVFLPGFVKNKGFKVVLLLLLSATIGLYFYQGNFGVLYDYYMTGYYLIFILLFSVVLAKIWQYPIGKIFVIAFMYLFLSNNLPVTKYKITDGLDGPQSIGFLNQKEAVDWIYKDAGNKSFNVDEYVPPVIPYAYDYLFKWYGGRIHGREPNVEQVSTLYTLYEVDPPHPERLKAWLDRQKGIGEVEATATFGGITVERRERIK